MSAPVLVTRGASRLLRDILNAFLTRFTGVQTLTDAATIAFDVSLGANAHVTLTTSRTFGAPTNARAGDKGILRITQPAGGSALATWNAAWKHPAGTDTVLSTGANAVDTLVWYSPDGTTFEIIAAAKAMAT